MMAAGARRGWAYIAGAVAVLLAPAAAAGSRLEVSVADLPWPEGERIVGYTMSLKGARIVTVRNVPADWRVVIDNINPWSRQVSGAATHGAGALEPEGDAAFFNQFVVIEIEDADQGSLSFDVSGEIWFTADFEKVRRLPLTRESLELHPVEP
jgi:hypothetical protein